MVGVGVEGEGWMIIIQWVWRVMAEVEVVVVVVGWEGCWDWVGSHSGLKDADRVKGMPRCSICPHLVLQMSERCKGHVTK